jgi:YheC/D like ATP-grasp
MLIGMFHYRKNPEKVSRAYLYSAIAKAEGMDFVYFTSKGVNFNKRIITGYQYEAGEWLMRDFPFPDVIMNIVGPITKKQGDIYHRLKKEIPFTSFPTGTKLSVYNRIKKDGRFKDYLIPYKRLKQPIEVLSFLAKHQNIIIKPISGHHGNQVIRVEKGEQNYILHDGERKEMNQLELLDYMAGVLKNTKMLMQKFISCKRKTGETYDIRLHAQKDGTGKWKNTMIYPKIGATKKVATNLGQGGQITILKNFLENEFEDEAFNIQRQIEVFSIQFVKHFDELYKHVFDEIGIDIGLDAEGRIWIYEVNWRPGQMFFESKAAKNAVQYAKWVAKTTKEEVHENTETE